MQMLNIIYQAQHFRAVVFPVLSARSCAAVYGRPLCTYSRRLQRVVILLQRVVENYYALQSTRIRPQRPAILMQIISPLLLRVLLKYDHALHDLIAETGIPS